MRIEFEQVADREFDFCIVGSGPAGIILALEYATRHPEALVLLIEYGADVTSTDANRLDETIEVKNLVNHHPPEECTNKGLGGSSATWGGRCVMYDEIDFLERPIVGRECTWDPGFLRAAEKFVGRAAEYFECGEGPFRLEGDDRIAEGFVEGPVTDSVVERWSLPTRFGARYRAELDECQQIAVLFGCEGRGCAVPDEAGRIEWLEIREVSTERTVRVRARHFALAAGAQESTRFLLRNPRIFQRLPKVPPALGRYYQGHVSGKIASVRFLGDPLKTEFGFRRDAEGNYLRRRFQFPTQTLLEHDLLNVAIWLDNPRYYDPAHRSGAMSFMYLAMITPILGKRLAPPAIAHSITKGRVTRPGAHVLNILRQLPGSLLTPARIFFQRYCRRRKLPGVFVFSPENRYALHFHGEQVPDRENRMELGADGETLVIHYRLTDADVDAMIRAHELLDEWLQKCGCGELEYWFPPEDRAAAIREMSRDGIHQSGTTRIAPDAERGVVDGDLRVWGTNNLYVCSSSAFPTSGQANPTFLLGAFAARLAATLD